MTHAAVLFAFGATLAHCAGRYEARDNGPEAGLDAGPMGSSSPPQVDVGVPADVAVLDASTDEWTQLPGAGATPLALNLSRIMDSADVDGDGKQDLFNKNTRRIHRSDGLGGYTSACATMPGNASAFALRDYNGDGRADLLALKAGTYGIHYGQADGCLSPTLTSVGTFAVPAACVENISWLTPSKVDFNGDGYSDFLISCRIVAGITNGTNVHTYPILSQNGPTYVAGAPVDLGTLPSFVPSGGSLDNVSFQYWSMFGDVDGDGKDDWVFFPTGSGAPVLTAPGNTLWTFKGTATGIAPIQRSAGVAMTDTNQVGRSQWGQGRWRLFDLSGDGKADWLFMQLASTSRARLSTGTDFAAEITSLAANSATTETSGDSCAHLDKNGDGKIDVVCLVEMTGKSNKVLATMLGNGDGTFTRQDLDTTIPNDAKRWFILPADVTGDGRLDIVTGPNDPALGTVVTFKAP